MSQDRKMKWLNDRRIIYRYDGIDQPDIETKQYKYYENGTYSCYHLFNTKAKITTYKSLKWHLLVLFYLNEDNEYSSSPFFEHLARFIAKKDNGFVTFFISEKALNDMIIDVYQHGGDAPKNKLRKVIFKPYNMLTLNQKLSIVGKLIGRRSICKETIYQAMIDISEHRKITMRWLAEVLGVSQRTVYRHMCDELKLAKQEMNEEI
tara:strand:- start:1240 stop:1857 length:618 start_codon:yes stop_codon:yes gene_type:complete